ncbi:hypothetical protein BDZ97DRAFT_1921857 [Flammula alnicola]|nr:hypothetical protein BDZ97DRAFT_1921857 [Flammula alnicola]
MARDRWFTRGWTLQELVAPREFILQQDWTRLVLATATKNPSNPARIETATGIASGTLNFMQGWYRARWSARRMVWAADRTTAREKIQLFPHGNFGVSYSIAMEKAQNALSSAYRGYFDHFQRCFRRSQLGRSSHQSQHSFLSSDSIESTLFPALCQYRHLAKYEGLEVQGPSLGVHWLNPP